MILRFVFLLAFQCRIQNYSTTKTHEDIAKRKWKTMVWLFFIFWIRSNKFRNFSDFRCSILISETIIRFVSLLAFQCRIPNYSTEKNSQRYGEKKTECQKQLLGFSSFFGFVQTYFVISRTVGVQFQFLKQSLVLSVH